MAFIHDSFTVQSNRSQLKIIIMKQVLSSIFAVALLFLTVTASAQNKNAKLPLGINDTGGYWVIESNVNHPRSSVIHFYNHNNVEIYSENIEGVVLKVGKKKTVQRLNKVLGDALLAWEQKQLFYTNDGLVRNIFKIRQ